MGHHTRIKGITAMEVISDFTTEGERKRIINEQIALGYRLKEEQRYIDGNHLIFTDEPEPGPPRDLATEIDDLKARVETLETK